MNDKTKFILFGLIVAIGLAANGFFVGRSIQRFKKEDRSISVKGLAEREVKSNLAVWTIKTKIASNNINESSKEIENQKQKILAFLKSNGFKAEELIPLNINVIDKLAKEYSNNEGGFRYIIESGIQVRTNNVDAVSVSSSKTDELLKIGVVIADVNDYNRAVSYVYTDLNKIKPEMLTEAIRNAKSAAEQFTGESNVKLSTLKKASQGLFTIVDRDAANMSANSDYTSSTNEVYKKIRVIVNAEYNVD